MFTAVYTAAVLILMERHPYCSSFVFWLTAHVQFEATLLWAPDIQPTDLLLRGLFSLVSLKQSAKNSEVNQILGTWNTWTFRYIAKEALYRNIKAYGLVRLLRIWEFPNFMSTSWPATLTDIFVAEISYNRPRLLICTFAIHNCFLIWSLWTHICKWP
jgi:hypothetical protein